MIEIFGHEFDQTRVTLIMLKFLTAETDDEYDAVRREMDRLQVSPIHVVCVMASTWNATMGSELSTLTDEQWKERVHGFLEEVDLFDRLGPLE